MRILFLSDNFPPEVNAPATRLFEHASQWVRDGHAVTVITCAPNFPEGKIYPGYRNRWRQVESVSGIRVVRVKTYITANEGFFTRTVDYLSFMIMGFTLGIFEKRPDVVVATSPQFFCAIGGWALAAVKRRPFVMELRDLWPASILAVGAMRKGVLIRFLESVEAFLYRRATLIVSVTESFRTELIRRGIAADKIRVVLNGVDLKRYRPQPRDLQMAHAFDVNAPFVVGYIGTHGMAHALPKVLDAAERLQDHPEIRFFFAGAGAERKNIEHQVAERGLLNVRLIPRQPKECMPALWSLCDLVIVPLRNHPIFATVLPSKIFEAMAMGVPILASLPEGEATALLRETRAGECVPPEDPVQLAERIADLAQNPERLRQMRLHAHAAVGRYSRERLAREMMDWMEQITRG
ncbi:MAG: glycosyltransferase family 4 protein [Gammaproteobacteria bacterium]